MCEEHEAEPGAPRGCHLGARGAGERPGARVQDSPGEPVLPNTPPSVPSWLSGGDLPSILTSGAPGQCGFDLIWDPG